LHTFLYSIDNRSKGALPHLALFMILVVHSSCYIEIIELYSVLNQILSNLHILAPNTVHVLFVNNRFKSALLIELLIILLLIFYLGILHFLELFLIEPLIAFITWPVSSIIEHLTWFLISLRFKGAFFQLLLFKVSLYLVLFQVLLIYPFIVPLFERFHVVYNLIGP
jgi:hypothetical protein